LCTVFCEVARGSELLSSSLRSAPLKGCYQTPMSWFEIQFMTLRSDDVR
jgi:hypothetical protein